MHPAPDVSSRPLIIGGMHRSGTSLTASLFADAGIDMGPELLGANESNPMGHFEDLGFFDFHRRALTAQGICGEGYTTNPAVSVPPGFETEARDLIAARALPGAVWGWKEPRTILFLDFWQGMLPEARHVFVFRRPWEVADSLYRRGDETFVLNPTFALDVWTHYNRLILDFVRRHPANCLVYEIAQVVADPDRMMDAARSRLGVPVARPTARFDRTLLTSDEGWSHAAVVREVFPDAWRTYEELCDRAGTETAAARAERSAGACAVFEWARASRAETRAARAAREAAAREAAARASAEREAAERERSRLESAERAARRKPLNRLVRSLRRGSAAVKRMLGPVSTPAAPPTPEPATPAPALLPFPRPDDESAAQRAA